MNGRETAGVVAGVAVIATAAGVIVYKNRHQTETIPNPNPNTPPSPPAPAKFTLSVAPISQVQTGQLASAVVTVTNIGGTAGATNVSGVIDYQGFVQGHWTSQAVTLQPGASQQVALQSESQIASMFGGDTLTATFAESASGQTVSANFQVQQTGQIAGVTSSSGVIPPQQVTSLINNGVDPNTANDAAINSGSNWVYVNGVPTAISSSQVNPGYSSQTGGTATINGQNVYVPPSWMHP